MFERFVGLAPRVVVLGHEHARRLRHEEIFPAHLALAALDPSDGVPIRSTNTDVSAARRIIEVSLRGASQRSQRPSGDIPFARSAIVTFELALGRAARDDRYYVNENDLVGATLEHSALSDALRAGGIDVATFREDVGGNAELREPTYPQLYSDGSGMTRAGSTEPTQILGPGIVPGDPSVDIFESVQQLAAAFGAVVHEPNIWPDDTRSSRYMLESGRAGRWESTYVIERMRDGSNPLLVRGGHRAVGTRAGQGGWEYMSELASLNGLVNLKGNKVHVIVEQGEQYIHLMGFESTAEAVRVTKSLRPVRPEL